MIILLLIIIITGRYYDPVRHRNLSNIAQVLGPIEEEEEEEEECTSKKRKSLSLVKNSGSKKHYSVDDTKDV